MHILSKINVFGICKKNVNNSDRMKQLCFNCVFDLFITFFAVLHHFSNHCINFFKIQRITPVKMVVLYSWKVLNCNLRGTLIIIDASILHRLFMLGVLENPLHNLLLPTLKTLGNSATCDGLSFLKT